MPDLADLESRARAAQTAFRDALAAWKRASGQPPRFLMEKPAVPMRADAFAAARVFADRHLMVAQMARTGGTGAEVGVQHGHFSRFLIDRLRPRALHLFDMSDALLRGDVASDPCVTLHLGDSSVRLGALPDRSFDWIYIDGDHRYAGVMKDARMALRKIKTDGVVFFNDYTTWSPGEVMSYGVIPAVNELVNEGCDMVGVALSPSGYFDVALRLPSTGASSTGAFSKRASSKRAAT